MRRIQALLIILLTVVAGCSSSKSSQNIVQPARANLYMNSVNIIMSDGSLCVGNRPGRAVDWTGKLSGCQSRYSFQVKQLSDFKGPRQVLNNSTVPADPSRTFVKVDDTRGTPHFFVSR